jgi:adenylate kinase
MYHERFNPSKKPGICDTCQGKLYQRNDDKVETVNARLEIYERSTEPLLSYYRDRSLLREIDGTGMPEAVSERITRTLQALRPPSSS